MNTSKYKAIILLLVATMALAGCEYKHQKKSEYSTLDKTEVDNDFFCKGLDYKRGEVPVRVHRLEDQYCYPVGIFAKPTAPDKCDDDHYHYDLISLDGHKRLDEGDSCGAGKKSEIEHTGVYYVKPEVVKNWNELWKKEGVTGQSVFLKIPI